MAIVQKNDFIELEFTARVKDTAQVFDTTNPAEAKKMGMQNLETVKPIIISVENKMTLTGLDKALSGKEVGKEYVLELKPEEAFGKRNPSLVKMIPLKLFVGQKIMPQKGIQLALDGQVVKIVSVSGGRVLTDFNNPLAGKSVIYNYKIIRKLEDQREKIFALQNYFFKRVFDFEVKDREVIIAVEKHYIPLISIMTKPLEEILGLKLKTAVIENK